VTVAAITFAASLQHLLQTPALYGQTCDFEGTPPPGSTPPLIHELIADPAIAGLGLGAGVYNPPVHIDGREVGVRAVDQLKGSIEPTVTEGRAPRSPDEILLGTKTLRALGKHIGDRVTMTSGARAVALRIVGRGVIPWRSAWRRGSAGTGSSPGSRTCLTGASRLDPKP